MNLHLQPKQFLFLYNCLKKYERDFLSVDDDETFESVKSLFENVILGAFEEIEIKALSTGFDKWVKSETNKIQGLEDELKKIKDAIPQDTLINKLTPVKTVVEKQTTKGRPRKKK